MAHVQFARNVGRRQDNRVFCILYFVFCGQIIGVEKTGLLPEFVYFVLNNFRIVGLRRFHCVYFTT